MVLVIALLGETIGIASAFAEDEAEDFPSNATDPLAPTSALELPNMRTATSNTFQLPNGERESRLYETPVNYRDEDGDWQPIDEGLEETAGGTITNGENSFDVRLPQDLDEVPVKVTIGDAWVSETPLGLSTSPPELEGNLATYPAESGKASLEFSGLANGLKENIQLASPSAPTPTATAWAPRPEWLRN